MKLRIAAHFPRVSRAAVSKHLRVLREAQLVRARERGREWHYSLDARPLATVYREWMESFAPYWEESLGRLKRRVEVGDSLASAVATSRMSEAKRSRTE